MALYFLVLESTAFHDEIRPALAACWRQRSFGPCRPLCAKMVPIAQDFAARYHVESSEPLLARIAEGLPFDRLFWQHLAGELLWFSAVEIPELQTNMEALACLVAPKEKWTIDTPRSALPAIVQAHRGSRDLFFGGGFYRPEHAGLSDAGDVARLATYLGAVRPDLWQAQDLAALTELPEDQREEELAFLRDWFPALHALYEQAACRERVIVCETLE